MFSIDKEKFGSFVAALRKQQGLTQKELAAKLSISDKAISKWETGVSIPDVALLVPLAEILGVSVTDLLHCQRTEETLDETQVENIVKTAIHYSQETAPRRFRPRGLIWYLASLTICAAELAALYLLGYVRLTQEEPLALVVILGAVFGLYFLVFATEKLPDYYDHNRISSFSDGPVRMNIPGVRFNNRNWPHILRAGQLWAMGTLTLYPLLSLGMHIFVPGFWEGYERIVMLALLLGGLFVPMVVVGRKYQ